MDTEKAPASAPPAYDFPDGGLEAWLVVAGGWLALFATFGYVNAFGVYQSYYVGALHQSDSAISWVGSVQLWLQLSMGIVVGPIFDMGYGRILVAVGSIVYVVAIFMTSLCKEYWQIFLAQGLAAGLGLGITFIPIIGVIPHWFKRRRALATGIVVSGSSVGGICFPIMLNKLFASIGYAKGVRASGYIILGCMILANILVKPRIPGRKYRPAHMQFPAPDMKAILRHDAYWATIAGGFLIIWGLFMPIFYLQVYAETHGINKSLAFYSLSILNAGSVFGRTIPNLLADTYGPFNMLIIASVGAGAMIFAMFGATNVAGVVCFALFYGFFSGAYVSLLPGCFASLSSHLGEVGVRMGFAWSIVSLAGLTGPPINGALLGDHGELHWWKPVLFSGIIVLAGAASLVAARALHARRLGKSRI